MADGSLAYGAVWRRPRWQPPAEAVPASDPEALAGLFPDEAEGGAEAMLRPAAPFLALARSTPGPMLADPVLEAMAAPERGVAPARQGIAAAGLVETAEGLVPAEELLPGDRVITRDRGMQPLIRVTRHAAVAAPGAIRVARNAFGPGLPARDLVVAPGHRFFLRSPRAEAVAGRAEVLVAAGDMLGLPGIAPAGPGAEVEAVQLVCPRHELVRVEGLWCETVPCDETPPVRRALPACAARELFGL